jgi:hypothetical protein
MIKAAPSGRMRVASAIRWRENLAVLRHIALSRLKNDDTMLGLQNKRLKAACNEDYLTKLLFELPKCKDDAGESASANICCA